MTGRQKQLVRQTFAQLEGHSSVAALLFYRRLFTLDPSLRALFHRDIEAQGRKLFDALAFVVGTLDAPQTQKDAVASLGRRHASYGVQPEHYDLVRSALLWMFEEDLGPAFSAEARVAWEKVYDLIATIMKEAAAEMNSFSTPSELVSVLTFRPGSAAVLAAGMQWFCWALA